MANTKHIEHDGAYTSTTFNLARSIEWGANGRLRGLVATPNAANTQVTPTTPGAFILSGIVVQINDAVSPVAVAGTPPYALTATTASDVGSDPITFAVESYTTGLELTKAVLAITDGTGFNWSPTVPLGIKEIADLANTNQLTTEELNLLTAREGTIDDASILHTHRGIIRDQVVFETLTNLDFNKLPHVPLGRAPVSADELHTHDNILTDAEIDALTARGGIQPADTEHTHAFLPSAEGYAAVFGGPTSDASDFHTHPIGAHGNVINPRPTLIYVPQNTGSGEATLDATDSTFTGSIALRLGASLQGGPIDSVIGIRYKEFARFFYSNVTSAIGTNTVVGVPVAEQTETFAPGNTSGVVAPIPFGQEFTWRGIKIKVTIPQFGAIPFVGPTANDSTGDFFSYHGIVAAATPLPGFPGCPVTPVAESVTNVMQERLLSRAPLRLVPVLDERFPEGGFFSSVYI